MIASSHMSLRQLEKSSHIVKEVEVEPTVPSINTNPVLEIVLVLSEQRFRYCLLRFSSPPQHNAQKTTSLFKNNLSITLDPKGFHKMNLTVHKIINEIGEIKNIFPLRKIRFIFI